MFYFLKTDIFYLVWSMMGPERHCNEELRYKQNRDLFTISDTYVIFLLLHKKCEYQKWKYFFGHPVPKCPLSVLFNSLSSCKRCSKSYKGRELVRHTSLCCCCYSLGKYILGRSTEMTPPFQKLEPYILYFLETWIFACATFFCSLSDLWGWPQWPQPSSTTTRRSTLPSFVYEAEKISGTPN